MSWYDLLRNKYGNMYQGGGTIFFFKFLTQVIYPREVMKRRKNVEKAHLNIVYNPEKLKTMSLCSKCPSIVFEHPDKRNIL